MFLECRCRLLELSFWDSGKITKIPTICKNKLKKHHGLRIFPLFYAVTNTKRHITHQRPEKSLLFPVFYECNKVTLFSVFPEFHRLGD